MELTVEQKQKRMQYVVDETVEWYNGGPDRFGFCQEIRDCVYFDSETGNMCAVGRCLIDPEKFSDIIDDVEYAFGGEIGLDLNLKEQYRGLPLGFWKRLQGIHDTGAYNGTIDPNSHLMVQIQQYIDGGELNW